MKSKNTGSQTTCSIMPAEVSVLYSEDCRSWVSLFKSELNSTDSICFREYCMEELTFPLKPSEIQRLSRSRAVAVIISEGFLRFLESNSKSANNIAGCIRPSSAVAILVGVAERDIRCSHKALLVSYLAWPKFVINGNRSIPLQAVSAVRNMFGSSEGTLLPQGKEMAKKSVESAPPLKKRNRKAHNIRENDLPFGEQSEGIVSVEEEKAMVKNIKSVPDRDKMEDIVQKEVTVTNTESQPLDIKSDTLKSEVASQILMVPRKVDKDDNCVFLIFTNLLNNAEDVCVILERNIIKEPNIQILNPYVIFFSVPEQFFTVKGHVNVHIRSGNQLLDVKCLQIVTSSIELSHNIVPALALPLEQEPVYANEKLPLSYDGEGAEGAYQDSEEDHTHDYNDYCKPIDCDDDDIPSFLELCTQLGLNEWPIDMLMEREHPDNERTTAEKKPSKINHEATESVILRDVLPHKDTARRSSFQLPIAAPEIPTQDLRRSESLPTVCFTPGEQDHNSNKDEKGEDEIGGYIDMSATYKSQQKGRKHPHELILEGLKKDAFPDSRHSSVTSHVYVTMKLQETTKEQTENALSQSQQELLSLLQAFKRGIKTISEVEQHFQEWHQKYKDSTDDRDVVLRRNSRQRCQKERKRQSFGLTDIVRLIAGKPKKKTSKPKIRLDDSPRTRLRLDPKIKRRERNEKTGSKMSISSVSSAASVCSDGNLERKRDSGSYSDSNEESKNKPQAVHDDRSTKWFLNLAENCSLADSRRPPTLPSRPPPVANAPELPSRPPPKLPDQRMIPPSVPPKPPTLLKSNQPEKKTYTPKKKKSKADSALTLAKKVSRSGSPEYVSAKMYPPCPPKIREQIQQVLLTHQREARKNGEAMDAMKHLVELHPRKTSAPDISTRSNSPRRNLGPDQTICRIVPVSPLVVQKEHHSRYKKAMLPTARRSSSCPNFLESVCREHKVHTYLELSDYLKMEAETDLASVNERGSIPDEPPPLPPRQ